MIIKNAGTYRLLEPLTMRGQNSVGTMPKGTLLTVSQVDVEKKQVIGPAFPDWMFWNLPVEPYTEEMEDADAIQRGKEYFGGTRKAYSQDQVEQYIGMSDIQGINRESLIEFFKAWEKETEHLLPQTEFKPGDAEKCADYFVEYFIKPTTIDGK